MYICVNLIQLNPTNMHSTTLLHTYCIVVLSTLLLHYIMLNYSNHFLSYTLYYVHFIINYILPPHTHYSYATKQSSTSASPKQSWAWISSVRPSPVWVKPPCSYSLPFTCSPLWRVRYMWWCCATLVSWPFRSKRNTRDFPSIYLM